MAIATTLTLQRQRHRRNAADPRRDEWDDEEGRGAWCLRMFFLSHRTAYLPDWMDLGAPAYPWHRIAFTCYIRAAAEPPFTPGPEDEGQRIETVYIDAGHLSGSHLGDAIRVDRTHDGRHQGFQEAIWKVFHTNTDYEHSILVCIERLLLAAERALVAGRDEVRVVFLCRRGRHHSTATCLFFAKLLGASPFHLNFKVFYQDYSIRTKLCPHGQRCAHCPYDATTWWPTQQDLLAAHIVLCDRLHRLCSRRPGGRTPSAPRP